MTKYQAESINDLINPLQQATTLKQLRDIHNLRKEAYKQHLPEIKLRKQDPFDKEGIVTFGAEENGVISSTSRMVIDSGMKLPDESVFHSSADKYRSMGLKLMEAGRFVIKNHSHQWLKLHYRAVYYIAKANNVDVVLMLIQKKSYSFHRKLMRVQKLPEELNNGFGSGHTFISIAWEINKTPEAFHSWAETTDK